MKPKALTLVFSLILTVLAVGTLLLPTAVATIIAETVDFDPKALDLYDPEEIVTATIRFSTAHGEDKRVVEINTSTVLLDGSLAPIDDSNRTRPKPPEYLCDFDGESVRDILWLKIYHVGMEPNPQGNYVVHLTITGKLYDGTPFTGEGHIQVKPKKTSPPPPTT